MTRQVAQQAVESKSQKAFTTHNPGEAAMTGHALTTSCRKCLRSTHLQLQSSKALLDELLSLLCTLLRAACAAEQGVERHLGRLLQVL